MSYNGIGLSTARGSGTNGFIQKNYTRSNNETSYSKRLKNKQNDAKRDALINNSDLIKDKELVKHDEKRSIELKVSEYRDKLEEEDEDMDDDEIDAKCKEYKEELIKEFNIKQGYKSRRSREDSRDVQQQDHVDY